MLASFAIPIAFALQLARPIVDPNQGGNASQLTVEEVLVGRLVDVYSLEAGPGASPRVEALYARDLVIDPDLVGTGPGYRLEQDLLTGRERLVILHSAGSPAFDAQFAAAESGLVPIAPVGLDPSFLPPFPVVERNAAVVVRFNDLLDPQSIANGSLAVTVGSPPVLPFEARVLADPNHGGISQTPGFTGFHTTRVVFDLAIDALDASAGGLQVDPTGLPPATSTGFVNGAIRIPTTPNPAVGVFSVLRNLSGEPVTDAIVDPLSATDDVVRAFRSGSPDFDPFAGYLPDVTAPDVVARQPIEFLRARPLHGGAPQDVLVNLRFEHPACAPVAVPGHRLRVGGGEAEVLGTRVPGPNGLVRELLVRVLFDETDPMGLVNAKRSFGGPGPSEYYYASADAPGIDGACFLEITPLPSQPPASGIASTATIGARFTEPISEASPFDHIVLLNENVANPLEELVVSTLVADASLTSLALAPLVPLDHEQGLAETYRFELRAGAMGLSDQAGNPLASRLAAMLELDPAEPTVATNNLSLVFDQLDEDEIPVMGASKAEIFGQLTHDLPAGLVRPRPVSRQSIPIDDGSPLYSVMTSTGSPLITPISPLGSRMMTVWRYADAGFDVLDPDTANVDIEGVSWSPLHGNVSVDFFFEFEMTFAHGAALPDEFPIPIQLGGGGYAMFPQSGLSTTFADNPLNDPLNAPVVVHPRSAGYLIDRQDLFTTSSGTAMIPFPLNRTVPQEDFRYYTWRDTAILGKGGANGFGADVKALATVGALCDADDPTVYEPGEVRSLALPLLMDLKCFPDNAAIGLNGVDTLFALASERLPAFRVFSTGGLNKSGVAVAKNPDLQPVATGGFDSITGAVTPPDDNTVLPGQLDLVVRVSRAYTIWFDSGSAGSPDWFAPVLEPRADQQPDGTSVVLAFRGADAVAGAQVLDPDAYDLYGDPLETRTIESPDCTGSATSSVMVDTADIAPAFFGGDGTWHADIDELDGARFVQARITFVNNAASGASPSLSSFGLALTR